ncbi:polysaccharide biosynthesis/export family protein [Acinetobacter sp.]|uniref:polysaccharide biosynthesis/export family protein n=1 Tax=Acinetobacter sp. TaxID=472 RepID=UPI00388D61F6
MNYRHLLSVLTLSLSLVGCAGISGFQTYNLPKEGIYKTQLGTQVNIVKLTQDTLPAGQSTQINALKNYAFLFKNNMQNYHLSPGDILSLQLWAYPEISAAATDTSNGYQIDQNGYIQFPMIGRYKAVGKTLTQVNQELRSQLAHYLKNPDVVVRILAYQGQRYSVLGNVKAAGQFYLSDQPVSVYTALGLAGGMTEQGDSTSIQLVRQGLTYDLNTLALEKSGFSLHNLLIQSNDTLYVNSRENQKIYVIGEAGTNKALPVRDQGMTLSDVLGESQGINPLSANAGRIYVLRNNQNNQMIELYHLSLKNLGDFGLANQFQMHSNDIVYVDATGLTRWQRVISQIIPFSNIVSTAIR